ncbi:Uma2 family endonuclease [Saccharothrix luteola]|uniref:Uma2 family endonuclease n=1 Tax=Saccharothrix luteola TaxID=2893018 RepID=UPI001E2D1988|nr:Uma2 family endonuclease [Saccharothrix luteola]MCC8251425.1 Uma2 family endonuclease [Saccharothrix luteola]
MTVMAHDQGGRPYTVEDLGGMPDDGRRYELIDGMLLVSPAPGARHQKVVLRLGMFMELRCPDDLHVFSAPFSVRTSESNELQPDLLVARDADLTDKLLPVAPLLAVEVLSPSTALNDLNTKKAAYERMGVRSYWIIDPQDPKLTVFELDADGCYGQVAEVKGEDSFDATLPFPVRIVPAQLLGTLYNRPVE